MKGNEKKRYDLSPQNLNEAEAQNRLDLYSKQGDEKQYFSIQKIKKRYLNNNRVKSDKRAVSDAYLAQGYRAGFTHASPDTIRYSREIEDQSERDQVLREGRNEYRKGENLSKWFNDKEVEKPEVEPKNEVADKAMARKQIGKLMADYNRAIHPKNEELSREFKSVRGRNPDRGIDR